MTSRKRTRRSVHADDLQPEEQQRRAERRARLDAELAAATSSCLQEPCFPYNPRHNVNIEHSAPLENSRIGNTNWCTCDNCISISMPTEIESVCCREIRNAQQHIPHGSNCITANNEFLSLCLDVHTIDFLYRFMGATKNRRKDAEYNRNLRKIAYRVFTTWVHDVLGASRRRPVPSCAMRSVREAFPDPEGVYCGFKQNSDYNAADMAVHVTYNV